MPGPASTSAINEEVIFSLKEELFQQKILLSIYDDIITAADKSNLLEHISPRLRQLFGTEDFFICRYDTAEHTIGPCLRVANDKRKKNAAYQQLLSHHFPSGDRFFTTVLNSAQPVQFSLDEMCSWSPALPYAAVSRTAGIKECLSVPLYYSNQPTGMFTLWSDQEDGFSPKHHLLLQKVAAQVSLILNIMTGKETLHASETDNKILLGISNELATIREKEELLIVLKSQLEKLGFYHDITIARVNADQKTFSRFLVNSNEFRLQDKDYPAMLDAQHSFPDGVFEKALYAKKVILFELAKITALPPVPAYVEFLYRNGTSHMAGISLRERDIPIAALFLFSSKKIHFSQRQLTMVEAIANMLGPVVANILATEEITKQLAEIGRYKEQLEDEKLYLQEEIAVGVHPADIIGNSSAMQVIFHQLSQVAVAATTVLLQGETGTGKEVIARAIHQASPGKNRMMIKVNCAALPPTLIESELFGHEKGSFTGAIERRIGKFELAHGGTLFLDEIGEIPKDIQAKLLRAIQEKEIERIGGKAPIKINVRIIAATNRNLQKEVDEGRFRKDLYYRLNVFPITMPPLRDRKEDIPLLINHFIKHFSRSTGKPVEHISAKAMKQLAQYDWPGNVREMEHLIERTILTTSGKTIKEIHLPVHKKTAGVEPTAEIDWRSHEENERDHIIRVLSKCKGKIYGTGGAAEILRLKVSTLNSKIKKLGIKLNKEFK